MKRILSFILSLIMVVLSVNVIAVAEEKESAIIESDCGVYDTSSVDDAKLLLNAVGLAPSFPSLLTDKVNRADFTTAIMSAFKLSDFPDGEVSFLDVTAEDAFCPSVINAVNLGILSDGKYFRPYDAVTYSEAIKMIIVALGYNTQAQARGGWPYGYIAIAAQIDFDEGIKIDDVGATLTTAQAYMLIANMLEADMLVMDAVVVENNEHFPSYSQISNLLYVIYNWYPIEGVITSNSITHIYDADVVSQEGYITINDVSFLCDEELILGSYVEGYAIKEGATEVVKYIKPNSDRQLALTGKNSPELSGGEIVYFDNEKEKSISLDRAYSVIYNGKSCLDFDANDLDFDVGRLTLVNSDDDSDYDILLVYNGSVTVVDAVNRTELRAVDSFTGTVYDLGDENCKVFINGEKVLPGSVTKGGVYEAYISKDGKYTELHHINNIIEGQIVERSKSGLIIDGIEYECTDYFINRYLAVSPLGSENSFYLTNDDKIAALLLTPESTYSLGYVYRVGATAGLDKTLKLRMFTEDGAHETYAIASKIRVNESTSIQGIELQSYFTEPDGTLIRYLLNDNDEIYSIIFPEAPANTSADSLYVPEQDGTNVLKPYVIDGLSSSEEVNYKIFGVFVPHFSISDNTTIFCVDPVQEDDEKKYSLGTLETWANDTKISLGSLNPYNVSKLGRADIIVVKQSASSALGGSRYQLGGVIDSISHVLDADGDEAIKIVVAGGDNYTSGYTTLFVEKDNSNYSKVQTDLGFGDFIIYTKDKFNNLLEYSKEFDYSSEDILRVSSSDNDSLAYYYGTLGDIDNIGFSLDLLDSSTSTKSRAIIQMHNTNNEKTWVVYNKMETVGGFSYDKLSDYSNQGYKVLVRTYAAEPFQIILYQE